MSCVTHLTPFHTGGIRHTRGSKAKVEPSHMLVHSVLSEESEMRLPAFTFHMFLRVSSHARHSGTVYRTTYSVVC